VLLNFGEGPIFTLSRDFGSYFTYDNFFSLFFAFLTGTCSMAVDAAVGAKFDFLMVWSVYRLLKLAEILMEELDAIELCRSLARLPKKLITFPLDFLNLEILRLLEILLSISSIDSLLLL
jgi:hypothetical protein